MKKYIKLKVFYLDDMSANAQDYYKDNICRGDDAYFEYRLNKWLLKNGAKFNESILIKEYI